MKKKNFSFNWSESMYKPPFDITSEMLHQCLAVLIHLAGTLMRSAMPLCLQRT
jgi:hypothetical protein